ncbi:MAG: hypothetical protein HRU19_11780 [Pseudobacteriovorax sp.]|nr:hypothetical protein [Pseudobacteriovorax sp.]
MKTIIAVFYLMFTTHLVGGPAYLFNYKANNIEPVLATKVTKVDNTTYKVEIDTSKKVEGKNLTAEFVKNTLEGKLGKRLKLKANIDNPTTLTITFKGSEKLFLNRVAKTKISSRKVVALAMESTVSDSSIRAKKGSGGLGDDQVKMKITKISDTEITGLILGVGKTHKGKIKKGRKTTIYSKSPSGFKKGDKTSFSVKWEADKWWLVP